MHVGLLSGRRHAHGPAPHGSQAIYAYENNKNYTKQHNTITETPVLRAIQSINKAKQIKRGRLRLRRDGPGPPEAA